MLEIIRKVDDLGRLVIPEEFCKAIGADANSSVLTTIEDNCIKITFCENVEKTNKKKTNKKKTSNFIYYDEDSCTAYKDKEECMDYLIDRGYIDDFVDWLEENFGVLELIDQSREELEERYEEYREDVFNSYFATAVLLN